MKVEKFISSLFLLRSLFFSGILCSSRCSPIKLLVEHSLYTVFIIITYVEGLIQRLFPDKAVNDVKRNSGLHVRAQRADLKPKT
jgi:hypothetical protein